MATQFPITSGPSKWDLSIGLFEWAPRRPVVFNMNCPTGTVVEVFVSSVQADGGSGESWNIEGIVGDVLRPTRAGQIKFFIPESGQRVFINYRTDRRQGNAKFFAKDGRMLLCELDTVVQQLNERQFGDSTPVRR